MFGKGISGGRLIGQSDLRSVSEYDQLLKLGDSAHKSKDSSLLRLMGKKYNFQTNSVSNDVSKLYKKEEYLNFANITNSIFDMFKVDKNLYRYYDPQKTVLMPSVKLS